MRLLKLILYCSPSSSLLGTVSSCSSPGQVSAMCCLTCPCKIILAFVPGSSGRRYFYCPQIIRMIRNDFCRSRR